MPKTTLNTIDQANPSTGPSDNTSNRRGKWGNRLVTASKVGLGVGVAAGVAVGVVDLVW